MVQHKLKTFATPVKKVLGKNDNISTSFLMQSISMEVQKGKEDFLTKEINADVLCFNASTCIQFRPMVNQVLSKFL